MTNVNPLSVTGTTIYEVFFVKDGVMKERIWGLDLGTTSIGFAVVDHDSQEQSGQIIKMGVRIFHEGVT